MPTRNKKYDLIVFGATSFVGKILCNYLVNEYTEPDFYWAMAARSENKLKALRDSLGAEAQSIPLLVANADNADQLHSLCRRAKVIISTVGPYALYGEPLIKVCAETGTDYCDLTGEAQWVRRMINKYEAVARNSGARIVNCCGYDSIPSDLGVRFLQDQALQRFGRYCTKIQMGVKDMKGGASGGTIASGVNAYKEAAKDPELRKEMQDLYSLCPENHGYTVEQHRVELEYNKDFKSWVGPFIMAAINTRVVLRSNALMDMRYGTDFTYDEGTLTGGDDAGKKRAKRLARMTRIGGTVMAIAPLRWLALRFLPKPGEGPSPQQQREGLFDLRFVGTTETGDQIQVKVTGDRDPGYGSTAKMLSQAGISLLRDVVKADTGGFFTPASIYNDRLIDRLQRHAGLTFEVLSATDQSDDTVGE